MRGCAMKAASTKCGCSRRQATPAPRSALRCGSMHAGARSILASPIDPQMQARLNDLKDREDFRPVAPAVLAERLADWFEPAEANGGRAPFMLFTYGVKPGRAERIPSACHSDRSARVQT